MAHQFTEDDEGKKVIGEDGEEIGVVSDVEMGTAYVTPDAGITEKFMAKLGWAERDEETYPLQEEMVAEVTDDEVRLGGMGTMEGSMETTGTETADDIGTGPGDVTDTQDRRRTDDDELIGSDREMGVGEDTGIGRGTTRDEGMTEPDVPTDTGDVPGDTGTDRGEFHDEREFREEPEPMEEGRTPDDELPHETRRDPDEERSRRDEDDR